ncbi:protein MFI isoform X4 [Heterodontus francisci]|uniref:protein MFI isoform X4 n=1 Tax=Heterodontus francisci TaxID=7792 RepID=UPI00355C872A
MTEEIAPTSNGCSGADMPDASSREELSPAASSPASEVFEYEISLDKELRATLAELENSARIIQRAWRRHVNIQVFKHYKNMINFRRKGNPRFMMKCINPIEAELLDSAAGVHVRFRLGGKLPRQVHNYNPVKNEEDDCSGWYKRLENNDWRCLSDKHLGTSTDYMEFEPNRKTTTFHHCIFQRRQEVMRKQKQRKFEWMKKMYHEGMLQAQTQDPNTAVLVQRATEGVINSVEQNGPNAVLDWEVDELLEWTNALNFEKYLNDWMEIASSDSSANFQGTGCYPAENDLYKRVRLCVTNTYATMQRAAQCTI